MAREIDGLKISGSFQGNFKCTWTIKNFSSLDSSVGKSYKSKKFQLEEKGTEWYLKIYPGGELENCKGYVSFFVHHKNKEAMKFKFSLSFRNNYGLVLFEGTNNNEWIVLRAGHGYPQTIRTKDFESQLVNDVLVIVLEATYCATYVKGNFGTSRTAEITPTISCTENWRHLFENREDTDCVISVKGIYIFAHSLVLSAHSKVFAATLKHDMLKKNTCRVPITDFEKSTMVAFVEFIYSGTVREMNFNLALELLRASDKYEVSHLKLYCSNYLMSLLSDANVCQIFVKADMFNADKLKNHALEYICENLSENDLEAQRSVFDEKPDLLWSVLKQFFRKRRLWRSGDSE